MGECTDAGDDKTNAFLLTVDILRADDASAFKRSSCDFRNLIPGGISMLPF